MTTPTKIRRLDPGDDLGELTRLLHRAYADLARQGLRYVATHQDLETTRNRVAEGDCFVAEPDALRALGATPPRAATEGGAQNWGKCIPSRRRTECQPALPTDHRCGRTSP
ncbi:MAG: hypothetical protein CME06_18040 [Gemmatimonadetes bacterium]|nr:hypothetical protein [Gemmatimonadota bacterium]